MTTARRPTLNRRQAAPCAKRKIRPQSVVDLENTPGLFPKLQMAAATAAVTTAVCPAPSRVSTAPASETDPDIEKAPPLTIQPQTVMGKTAGCPALPKLRMAVATVAVTTAVCPSPSRVSATPAIETEPIVGKATLLITKPHTAIG